MVWKSNLEHTTGLQQNCYARMAGSCDMTMAHLIYPARDIACFSGWSNMNMYLCVYIYTPVTDSGTYLSKVYWLLCSEATVHWNKSPSRYVGLYTWATPYSWAARDGCLPMLIGSAPVFPHGNPIFGCWKLQNNHVRLVKIGLGRELVNPIYHHRNLLLFWGKKPWETPPKKSSNQNGNIC